jgi:hypothetical protein
VDSLTAASDLENSSSGSYVRGIMHEGSQAWALLAAAPSEDAVTIQNTLAFGMVWLDWTRSRAERRAAEGLRLFVPQGTSQRLRERLLALSASTRAEIYKMRDPDAAMQEIDPVDAGNLESWLVPRDHIEGALHAAHATTTRICAMLPANADAIECRVSAATNEVALAFHGMQFARWTKQGVFFAWEIPPNNSPLQTNAPSSACCINSISTVALSPATQITRCIAPPQSVGSNPWC